MTEKDISGSKGEPVIIEKLYKEDFQPDTPVTVVVPKRGSRGPEAEKIQTEFRFLEGDLHPVLVSSPLAAIRFEEKEPQKHHTGNYKEFAERGARIFLTEADMYLVVHSDESLQYKEELIASQR